METMPHLDPTLSPFSAFLLLPGVRTLQSADAAALASRRRGRAPISPRIPLVEWVRSRPGRRPAITLRRSAPAARRRGILTFGTGAAASAGRAGGGSIEAVHS